MRFSPEDRSNAAAKGTTDPDPSRAQSFDLKAFALRASAPVGRWLHIIRRLDSRGRLSLPEAAEVAGSGQVAARLCAQRWELRPASRGQRAVVVDRRNRVHVPIGVRHQLGLDGPIVVSLALDQSLLVVWPSSRLDDLLENP